MASCRPHTTNYTVMLGMWWVDANNECDMLKTEQEVLAWLMLANLLLYSFFIYFIHICYYICPAYFLIPLPILPRDIKFS